MTVLATLSGLTIGMLLVILYVAATTIGRRGSQFRGRRRQVTRLEVSLRLTAAAAAVLGWWSSRRWSSCGRRSKPSY